MFEKACWNYPFVMWIKKERKIYTDNDLCLWCVIVFLAEHHASMLAKTLPSMSMKVPHLSGFHFLWSLKMEMETSAPCIYKKYAFSSFFTALLNKHPWIIYLSIYKTERKKTLKFWCPENHIQPLYSSILHILSIRTWWDTLYILIFYS